MLSSGIHPTSPWDDRDEFAAELRRRCGSAQTFRQVWALVEPLYTAWENGEPLGEIVQAGIESGVITAARDE